jgi:hypothetical protein
LPHQRGAPEGDRYGSYPKGRGPKATQPRYFRIDHGDYLVSFCNRCNQ